MPRKTTRRHTVPPLTAAESAAVRTAVERGELHWTVAQDRLAAAFQGGRLWKSAEWTALRDRLIKDSCEQCGTREGPFTLQHLWQPPTIAQFASKLRRDLRPQLWAEFKMRMPVVEATEERFACPRCESVNIYARDSMAPRWKCGAKKQGRTCAYEFDEPVRVQAPAYTANAARKRERWAQFQAEYARHLDEVADAINVEATLGALELFERYMAGERTATFCRKCAYMWDAHGARLCQACRTEWHKHHESGCAVCTRGVRYVLCRVCGEQRHSDAYERCFACAQQPGGPLEGYVADEELVGFDEHRAGARRGRDAQRSERAVRSSAVRATGRKQNEGAGPRLAATDCVVGARVLHERFGSGTITVGLHGDGRWFVVLFDNADWGTKRLSIEYAPLQRVSGSGAEPLQEDPEGGR